MLDERFAGCRADRHGQKFDVALRGMLENGVNVAEAVGRRVFLRPAAKDECAAGGGNPPELGTAQAAGVAERFDLRGLTVEWVEIQDGMRLVHVGNPCGTTSVAKCGPGDFTNR